ncbi:hypothetical protein EDB89DRAFT_1910888 [Lactarius sanguifluus]|nr:hypothetical protein EDB89DRAFT_1910888 [Lactarius sanguifluus]
MYTLAPHQFSSVVCQIISVAASIYFVTLLILEERGRARAVGRDGVGGVRGWWCCCGGVARAAGRGRLGGTGSVGCGGGVVAVAWRVQQDGVGRWLRAVGLMRRWRCWHGWWSVAVVVVVVEVTVAGCGTCGLLMYCVAGIRGGWVAVVVAVEVAMACASGQLGEGVEMAAWWWWRCRGNGVRVGRVDVVRASMRPEWYGGGVAFETEMTRPPLSCSPHGLATKRKKKGHHPAAAGWPCVFVLAVMWNHDVERRWRRGRKWGISSEEAGSYANSKLSDL